MNVIFDCTTLDNWAGRPTGINRVVAETGKALLRCLPCVRLGQFQPDGYCLEYNIEQRCVGVAIPLRAGDVIVTAGSNWDFIEHHKMLLGLRQQGIRLATLIHDVIPWLLPFSFGPGFADLYKNWLIEAIIASDIVFANSENTRRDLQLFAVGHAMSLPPVTVLRLGDEVPAADGEPSKAIQKKICIPYILTVGTIEYRKNHIMLLNAWRYMIEEQDYIPPKLYIVGRQGWLDGNIEYQIENDPRLTAYIEVLKGVEDADLLLLYQHTLFTLYPSFYEGWGLPVAESLCFGKPCIASDSSSMREIAPDLVRYAHPLLLNGWVEQIRFLADNPAERLYECELIRHNYKRISWKTTAVQLRDALVRCYPELMEGN